MCGIIGIAGPGWERAHLDAMVARQQHRGPDDTGLYVNAAGTVGLGHNRLSIIDLSPAGRNPMADRTGRRWIVFNGEIYNYLELRAELDAYPFRSRTDTEVVLAAYERWGAACLERFVGMFAFLLWDEEAETLWAARDRFGVKPLYYGRTPAGALCLASEIKTLHEAGVPRRPDAAAWATYLGAGLHDHSARTFWEGVAALPGGHTLTWRRGETRIERWYDLAARVGPEFDARPQAVVEEEYLALARDSIRLRFRSDVPVGINLSGGLDSSTLLGLVQTVQGEESQAKAFTYITNDERYDELPWCRQMLARTRHPSIVVPLTPEEVPALAASVQAHEDEPFGGLPTLAYARVFDRAREEGVIVLLDGQGMDEQWAGYDYYRAALANAPAGIVQGTRESPVRPACLTLDFAARAERWAAPEPFSDRLRNLQYRDILHTKIPRALRFNDRVSMRASTELREPFLDHRLFELALRQPPERKIADGQQKWLLRQMVRRLLPAGLIEAPKRPLSTPQREWLRGPLRAWADGRIEAALRAHGGAWLDAAAVREAWRAYRDGAGDNSFYLWQWISLGMIAEGAR